MNHFKAFFKAEWKLVFRRLNLLVILLFFTLSLAMFYTTVREHHQLPPKKEAFKKIETKRFEKTRNYTHFSFSGIRVIFVPAAIEVFFQKVGLSMESIGFIDSVDELKMSKNQKGRGLFDSGMDSSFRFSRYLLVLGGIIAMFWGFGTFRARHFTAFYVGMCGYRKVFAYILLSRLIILALLLLFLFGLMAGVLLVEGISLTAGDIDGIIVFFAVSLLMLACLFLIGVLSGLIKNRNTGTVVFLMAYFTLVLLIPGVMSRIVESAAVSITDTANIKLDKMEIIEQFETNAEKEFGKFDRSSIETERQILEKYFAVNFAELETTELKLLTEIEAAGSFARSLHMVTPVGFYSMVCNDVSSRGYENGIEMNRYMIRLMRKLVRFYIDQTVYGEQPPKLVPFIKGEENIFQGQSRFPRLFAPGAVLNTCYLLLLILAAYVLFKRNLYPPCKRADNYADIDTPLESGINTCIDMEDADLYAQHMGVFYGLNTTFAGRLTLDGESRGGDWAKDFLMLPDAGLFTGNITVAEFIEQSASLGGLSAERQRELLDIFAQQRTLRLTDTETKDRARLLLELAQRHAGKIIILSDFTAGLGGRHYTELDEIVNKLKAGGRAIVQINHRSYQVFAGVDRFISWQLKDGKFVDIRRRH